MPHLSPAEIPPDFHVKTAIMHTIDEPLENITVTQICTRCNISRSRFYELFGSKYDIGFWYLTFVYDASLAKIGTTLTWHEGITLCLELVDEEREYFARTTETPQNNRSLFWLIQEDRRRKIQAALEARGTLVGPKLRIEIDIYVELISTLLRIWVNMKEPCNVAQFADIWIDCIPRDLYTEFHR